MDSREFKRVAEAERNHFWFRAKRRMIMHYFKKYFQEHEECLVIDTGCGTGGDTAMFKNSVGADIDMSGLQYAAEQGVHTVCCDAHRLPFKSGSADLIISSDLLPHKNVDFQMVIEEYSRVLKRKGMAFINIPSYPFLFSVHDRAVDNERRFVRMYAKKRASGLFCVKHADYWNFFLLPAMVVSRFILPLFTGEKVESDVGRSAGIFNRAADIILSAEHIFAHRGILPGGASLFMVLEKR